MRQFSLGMSIVFFLFICSPVYDKFESVICLKPLISTSTLENPNNIHLLDPKASVTG